MRFLAVCFVFLFLVLQVADTTCFAFSREKKLSEFRAKLDRKIQDLAATPLASPPASSETKRVTTTQCIEEKKKCFFFFLFQLVLTVELL